eukprot:TRINITY_DN73613_c0_g1_i1.p1 TRINITY_DN73613_c0_g1~~TRINITY_DN73613_c0_g1_i1.p1  ORF type:complete len:640 (+),score=85.31 TRINITY_DN73613_c0_g1_i1:113-2032(+)
MAAGLADSGIPFLRLGSGNTDMEPAVAALGCSVHHLATALLDAVADARLPRDAKVHEVEAKVIRPYTVGFRCPNDGRPGSAYVDCLRGADHVGPAGHMLSYTWSYEIGDIVDTLTAFCERHGAEAKRTYVWICFLNVNQHRVKELSIAGQTVPFEEFRRTFHRQVTSIGSVIAMMAPWRKPLYLERVWTTFEMFTAMSENLHLEIAMPPREACDYRRALEAGTAIDEMWTALAGVKIQHAEASIEEDKRRILALIENGPGYHALNAGVSRHLQSWIVQVAMDITRRYPENDTHGDMMACLDFRVGQLLHKLGDLDQAMSFFQKSRTYSEDGRCSETRLTADVLAGIANIYFEQGQLDEAYDHFVQARNIHERHRSLESPEGANAIYGIAMVCLERNDLQTGLAGFEEARGVRERLGLIECPAGAEVFMAIGWSKLRLYDVEGALEGFVEAKRIREKTGTHETPEGTQVLTGLATVQKVMNDFVAAVQTFQEAKVVREQTCTLNTPYGAIILVGLASTQRANGNLEAAVVHLEDAFRIADQTGAVDHPYIAVYLNDIDLPSAVSQWKEELLQKKRLQYCDVSILKKTWQAERIGAHENVEDDYPRLGLHGNVRHLDGLQKQQTLGLGFADPADPIDPSIL